MAQWPDRGVHVRSHKEPSVPTSGREQYRLASIIMQYCIPHLVPTFTGFGTLPAPALIQGVSLISAPLGTTAPAAPVAVAATPAAPPGIITPAAPVAAATIPAVTMSTVAGVQAITSSGLPATGPPVAPVEDPAMPLLISPHAPPVPPAVVGRIWRGEYIEMAELLPEALRTSLSQEKKKDKRKKEQITSCQQWTECFLTFVAIVARKQPERVGDLLAYTSLIVHYARQFKGPQWLVYDTNFRLQAAATSNQKWAEVSSSLWAMAFGGAEWQTHCQTCSSLDHVKQDCPRQPEDSAYDLRRTARTEDRPICTRYNFSFCTSPTCGYRHICLDCHGNHRKSACPRARPFPPRGDATRGPRKRQRDNPSERPGGSEKKR